MAKKEKAPAVAPTTLRRRMVLISEADVQSMKAAFAAGKEAVVTVHAVPSRGLTDAQREKRRAYRQRPEVKERMKAYRQRRAARLREALTQSATSAEQGA
jgi:hypothetical protein